MPSSLPILDTIGLGYRVFGHAFGRFVLLFLLLFAVSLIVIVPVFGAKIHGASPGTVAMIQGVTTLIQFPIQIIVQMATLVISFRILEGQDCTIGAAISQSASRFFPMLGVSLLVAILVVLGMILLIVPGIVLALGFAVAVPVCLFEGLGVMASLRRSRELTLGQKWRILGIGAVIFIAFFLAMILLGILGSALLPKDLGPIVVGILAIIAVLALMPLSLTLPAVLYAQLRSIYEGHGPIGAAEVA